MKYYSIILIILFSNQLKAQNQKSTIIQYVGKNQQYILSGQQNFRHLKLFSTDSKKGTVEEENIYSSKPTHVYLKHIKKDKQGNFQNLFLSLVILPGDTVNIDSNKNIKSSKGFKSSIDSILNLTEDDYSPTKSYINELTDLGLRPFIENIKQRFLLREIKINALYNSLSKEHLKALHNFNYLLKAKNISQIPYYSIHLKNDEIDLLDSCYQDIKEKASIFNTIESNFSLSIYSFLLRYNAFKKNLPVNIFWDYAFNVDKDIQNSSYYLPYLLLLFENDSNDAKLPQKLILKLDPDISHSPNLNTFLKIMKILDYSLIDFDKAKVELANISNGKYLYLMKNEKNKQRNINSLSSIQLLNMANEKIDFKSIIINNNIEFTVIDFWASWCIPCIEEYPAFKNAKEIFNSKPVNFISVSIDKDEAHQNWKNMVNNLSGNNHKGQFRLSDMNSKVLLDYFELGPIPRYVVIDNKGKILVYDFFRPKDVNFQKVINLLLNNNY